MKNMVVLILGVVFVALAVSCGQSTVPSMPQTTSEEGKVCLKECQSNYNMCNSSCRGNSFQTNKCLSNCNIVLGDCYSTCP